MVEKIVTRLVLFETAFDVFFNYLKRKLPQFMENNFGTNWHVIRFKECLLEFPTNVVVLFIIDFVEIHSFQFQNEIQEQHQHSDQMTILVHITYRHNLLYNPSDVSSHWIIKECDHHLSNDQGCLLCRDGG